MPQMKQPRTLYFDVMNILACLAVIALHHNGHYHNYSPTRGWVFSLLVECFFYWAVPLFLMISGANLLDYHKKYSISVYLKKRFFRTVIPWFLWSIILLLWKILTNQFIPEYTGLSYYLKLIITNKVEATYWFFGTLFTCYLMVPVLTHITSHRRTLWYAVAVIFITSSVLPALSTWFGFQQSMVKGIHEPLILFFFLGYLLNTTVLTKKQRICLYLCGLLSVLYRLGHTYILSVQTGVTTTLVKGYSTWHSVLWGAAVFEFLKQMDWDKLLPYNLKKYLPFISSCSFGIYLLHKIPLYHLRSLLNLSSNSMLWKTVCIPLTYLVSLFIVILLKKIPKIGKFLF